jgi:hypothetical protein
MPRPFLDRARRRTLKLPAESPDGRTEADVMARAQMTSALQDIMKNHWRMVRP